MSLIRRLTKKPWEGDPGAFEEADGTGAFAMPTARIALIVFMAVVTVLFFLMTVAYNMRMGMSDWRALDDPSTLWINTSLLVLSSVAFQWAWMTAKKGNEKNVKLGISLAGALAIGFLFGQMIAWNQLRSLGYFAETNPSYAFFYMITAIHGLHLIGGLIAWARTLSVAYGGEFKEVAPRVELCAIYWHFLLVVWLAMFGLFTTT